MPKSGCCNFCFLGLMTDLGDTQNGFDDRLGWHSKFKACLRISIAFLETALHSTERILRSAVNALLFMKGEAHSRGILWWEAPDKEGGSPTRRVGAQQGGWEPNKEGGSPTRRVGAQQGGHLPSKNPQRRGSFLRNAWWVYKVWSLNCSSDRWKLSSVPSMTHCDKISHPLPS
jgi:hypothetical protein